MAYCSRCGKELPQGVKYCTECGAPVPQTENGPVSGGPISNGPVLNSPAAGTDQKGIKPDGPLMGIVAMLLGLASLMNHVTVISVGLSIAAIALAVRCLKKRARLKGFAIAAIVFAVLNFVTYAVPPSGPDSTGTTAAAARTVTEAIQEKAEQSEAAQTAAEGTAAEQTVAEQTAAEEEKNTGSEEKKGAGTEEKSDGAEDGVDPELKAFLDSYEDFVDEYIEFMQKYSANPTDLSLLAAYADIMQEYADFADKVEKYDSKDMSAEDSAYYIEVTSRCSQKMLRALGN